MEQSSVKNKKKIRKKRIIILVAFLLMIASIVWTIWGNMTIATTYYDVTSNRLPSQFEGYKIVQISDFHNTEFGSNNSKLVERIKRENPNIIVITGDLVDSSHTNIPIAVDFVKQIVEISPIYYVSGNHEIRLGEGYADLENRLLEVGVNVLHNEVINIEKEGAIIQLIGVDDVDLYDMDYTPHDIIMKNKLSEIECSSDYKILLSHRPELFQAYVSSEIDMVFAGHAHGGQVRLPFIGGLVAPNQGFFPQYDGGCYVENNTTMVVSRGLGNSIIPIRVNNRPELVVVNLHSLADN